MYIIPFLHCYIFSIVRPYIFVGAPFLVIFTILTFTVPGFEGTAKLVYAYVTYIGLGMAYTMTNVLSIATAPTPNPNTSV